MQCHSNHKPYQIINFKNGININSHAHQIYYAYLKFKDGLGNPIKKNYINL